VVGVATLPTWRRRGLGAAVTAFLVQDAGRRGAEVVFLSAGDDAVARVYERLGFRRVGVHSAAEPPKPAGH
jgi:predicted GNAT family acetyltransferase